MRLRKVIISILLGLLLGLLCASMAIIRKPVPITNLILVATVFNRTLIGFFLAFVDFRLVKIKWLNAILNGIIVGFLISYTFGLGFGAVSGIGFSIFGAIYGLIIALFVYKL